MGCSQSQALEAHGLRAKPSQDHAGSAAALVPCGLGVQIDGLAKSVSWRRLSSASGLADGEAIKVYEGPLYEVRTAFHEEAELVADFVSRVNLPCHRVVVKSAWGDCSALGDLDLEALAGKDHLAVLTSAGVLADGDVEGFTLSRGHCEWHGGPCKERRGSDDSVSTCASTATGGGSLAAA